MCNGTEYIPSVGSISVHLTPDEMHLAASHAILRRYNKHSGYRKDREQTEKSSWDNEINGCMAEFAWCKHRKTYWNGVQSLKATDGGDVEIRWTHHLGTGGLIVYSNDSDDSRFVLAEGYAPLIIFVGWCTGLYAKQNANRVNGIMILPRANLRQFKLIK